jgi:hypothetical protein
MARTSNIQQPHWYEIRVQGWIGERWTKWLNGMTISSEGAGDSSPVTILTGPIVDQAALRSLLAKLWDLNLTLVSLARMEMTKGNTRRDVR